MVQKMNSWYKLALLLLSSSSSILVNPLPESKTDRLGEPTETSTAASIQSETQCNQADWDTFSEEWNDCMGNAGKMVDETLLSDEDEDLPSILESICAALSEKLKCAETIGPKCLNEEQIKTKRLDILDAAFERTFNNSDVLGDDFIESCPVLIENERDLQLKVTGSTNCRYLEFVKRLFDWRKCRNDAIAKKNRNLSFLSFVGDVLDFYKKTWCNFRSSFLACNEEYTPCLGSSALNILAKHDTEVFKTVEDEIRCDESETLANFTFSSHCS